MVVYLDEQRAAAQASAYEGRYGYEIMHANWNPAVVHLFDAAQCAISPELPEDMSSVDVDAFLDRVYALATQI